MSHRVETSAVPEVSRHEPRSRNLDKMHPVANQRSYHVITRIGGGWSVHRQSAGRATATYDTKAQAIKGAREIARKAGGEMVIFNKYGWPQRSANYSQHGGSLKTKRR